MVASRSLKETWKDVENGGSNGGRGARIKTTGRNFLFRDVAASSSGATSTSTFITFHQAISSKRLNDSAPRLKVCRSGCKGSGFFFHPFDIKAGTGEKRLQKGGRKEGLKELKVVHVHIPRFSSPLVNSNVSYSYR